MTDFFNFKRPTGANYIEAYIDASATIGKRSIVWWYARVLQGVKIGDDVSIGGGSEIGRGTTIGDRSRIGSMVFLPPNSVVGCDVFIGPGVVCTDDKHPRVHEPDEPSYIALPPRISEGAAIGAGAVLLPGVRIGPYARIGAGAIVTRDVAENEHVRGEPARTRLLSDVSTTAWTHP